MYGTLISSVTVGAGGASSIDFTSIPGSYTDLVLVIAARTGGTEGTIKMTFNGSSSTYANILLYGYGSGVGSQSNTLLVAGKAVPSSATASTFGNSIVTIPNYANSAAKTMSADFVTENNDTTAYQMLSAGSWTGTAAITSLSLTTPNDASGFSQYSTAYLYGLTKGSGGATVS